MNNEPHEPTPVACTLDAAEAAEQVDDWAALQPLCARVEPTPTGMRLWFDERAEPQLREVARREAACCRFLELDVQRDGQLVRLEISSQSPGADAVIELLAAQASGR